MKLYNQIARQFLSAINAASTTDWDDEGGVGASGAIEFYTNSSVFAGDDIDPLPQGLFGTNNKISFSATPLPAPFTIGSTQATASFDFSASSATVDTNGIASYFAILNTNVTSDTLVQGNIVLTGSVSTSGGTGDLKFNVVDWAEGDQVTITALTFVQPR